MASPRRHRLFALLLAFPAVAVFATSGSLPGSGTVADPYRIADFADLAAAAHGVYSPYASYRLVSDIDASPSDTADGGAGFSPFILRGALHGGGHAITGLSIRRPDEEDIALIRFLDTAGVVDSLVLEGAHVEGTSTVATLVAFNAGTIRDCRATGTVLGGDEAWVGGLVGEHYRGLLSGCRFEGDTLATGDDGNVGGLAGVSLDTIRSCSASVAHVSGGSGASVGGLVGYGMGRIDSSAATGNATAVGDYAYAGGLVGLDFGRIEASSATGTARASGSHSSAGGLIGFAWGDSILTSFATGAVDAPDSFGRAGGLVGAGQSVTILRSFALGNVSAGGPLADAGGLAGILADSSSQVADAYAQGSVTGGGGGEILGGAVGYSFGSVRRVWADGRLVGSVDAIVGGIAGYAGGSILSCYWDLDASHTGSGIGASSSVGNSVSPLASAAMALPESFTGWDFDFEWSIPEGDSVPRLQKTAAALDAAAIPESTPRGTSLTWHRSGDWLTLEGAGALSIELRDAAGRRIARASGREVVRLLLPRGRILFATARSSSGDIAFALPSLR